MIGDESVLAVYRWANQTTGWQLIGGSVDTASNAVYARITQTGVYAAFTNQIVTDIEEEHGAVLPYRFELSQNYPNPFNPVTTIEYSLPKRALVTIEVYNVLGQRMRTLVDEYKPAGSYTTSWDGTDVSGKSAATGVYIYRFQAGNYIQTKKMLLLK
jgi:hypothetical protein